MAPPIHAGAQMNANPNSAISWKLATILEGVQFHFRYIARGDSGNARGSRENNHY